MTAKYAGFFGNMAKNPMALALAAPVGAAAVGGLHALGSKVLDARAKATGYREMMGMSQRLRKNKDRKSVQRIYSSLYRIAPTIAKDPLVAGAWVDNVVEQQRPYGEDAPNQALLGAVKDLAGIRSSLSTARSREQMGRFNAGQFAMNVIGPAANTHRDKLIEDARNTNEVAQLRAKLDDNKARQAMDRSTRDYREAAKLLRAEQQKHSSDVGARLLSAIR